MGKLIGKTYAAPAPAAGAPLRLCSLPLCTPARIAARSTRPKKGLADHVAKEHTDASAPGEE